LFEDFLVTGAGLAIGEELGGDELYAASTIDDIHETKLDGIGHGDFEINVPGTGGDQDLSSAGSGMDIDWGGGVGRQPPVTRGGRSEGTGSAGGASFLGELVKEGVFAVMCGPDGQVMALGDAALGSFPEQFGVGMFGEFIEANIAAVNGHGLRVGGKGDDARAVIEFDDTHFELVGESGRTARVVEARDFTEFFTVRKDGASEVEQFDHLFADAHVFEGAGVIFGGKEVIAILEVQTLANVFESVGKGPADANGFFGKGECWFALGADDVFGLNPVDLVWSEEFGEGWVMVDGEEGKDGGHGGWLRVDG